MNTYDLRIEPGTKFVVVAEVIRLATDVDLHNHGSKAYDGDGNEVPFLDPDRPWSHNKWRNKYLCTFGGKEFIMCIDQPEDFIHMVELAKNLDAHIKQEFKAKIPSSNAE